MAYFVQPSVMIIFVLCLSGYIRLCKAAGTSNCTFFESIQRAIFKFATTKYKVEMYGRKLRPRVRTHTFQAKVAYSQVGFHTQHLEYVYKLKRQ